MAVYQIASGSCTGRGFAGVDSSGWMANFKSWVTRDATDGGPGWSILYDKSVLPTSVGFVVSVTGVSNILDTSGHTFVTGDTVQFSSSGTLPTGLGAGTDYYVYKIDSSRFRACQYLTTAWDGTGINVQNTGSGTHSALLTGPYIVVSDQSSFTRNQSAMIMRAGYVTTESAKVRIQYALAFDTTSKILYGYWGGFNVNTLDAASFSYDFRGGAECLIVQSRIGSAWSTALIDSWVGDSNFVEGTDKRGTLLYDATAGSSQTLYLNTGEAANFTLNRYYYITDTSGHAWVNYCKVTADDTNADTVVVDALTQNFPAGSVLAAYTHRWYCAGNDVAVNIARFNTTNYSNKSTIPYLSSATYVFADQNGIVYSAVKGSVDADTLSTVAPNDRGFFACQKPFLVEYYGNNGGVSSGMTEGYGIAKNVYATKLGTMVAGMDGKTIGGSNWLHFQRLDGLFTAGSSNYATMFLDKTSLV